MKKALAVLGGFAVIGVASCGRIPPNRQVQPQVASALSLAAGQVLANSHQGGNRTLEVSIVPPITSAFTAQAIVHRWTTRDVTEYDLVLSAGGQDFLTVQVLPQSGQSSAVLTNLRYGVDYTISVTAKGNDGGSTTTPTQVLNAQTPAVATVSFTGDNDVSDEKSVTVQVQLDSVTFDGSATVSLGSTDGSYANPSDPESGYASSGSGATPGPAPTSEPTVAPSPTPSPASTPLPTLAPTPAWTLPPGT